MNNSLKDFFIQQKSSTKTLHRYRIFSFLFFSIFPTNKLSNNNFLSFIAKYRLKYFFFSRLQLEQQSRLSEIFRPFWNKPGEHVGASHSPSKMCLHGTIHFTGIILDVFLLRTKTNEFSLAPVLWGPRFRGIAWVNSIHRRGWRLLQFTVSTFRSILIIAGEVSREKFHKSSSPAVISGNTFD